jgi:tetratricopeptide (TPR) repeat protein
VDNADATTRTLLTDQRAAAHSHIGDALLFSGRWRDAVTEYRSELSLFKELVDPKTPASLDDLAEGCINLGHAESLAGNLTAGLKLIRTGIDTLRSRAPAHPKDRDRAVLVGRAFVYEGEALEDLGNESRALQSYKQATAMFESPTLAVDRAFNSLGAASYAKVAGALARLGYLGMARETYGKALAVLDSEPSSEPPTLHVQYALIEIYAGLGQVELKSARRETAPVNPDSNACKWYQKSMDIWLKLPIRNSISPSGFKVTDFDTVASQLTKCHR